MSDWLFDHFEWFLGSVVVAMLLVLGMGIYHDVTAEKFSLRKDGWECTQSHLQRVTTLVPAGKVLIPVVSNQTVCDEWRRK